MHGCPQRHAATVAAQRLASLLSPPPRGKASDDTAEQEASSRCREILTAIQDLVPTLTPDTPIFAAFHNGQVHDPLGSGSYAFQKDILGPVLSALANDENISSGGSFSDERKSQIRMDPENGTTRNGDLDSGTCTRVRHPTRPIVIHVGLQPNSSPHAGTIGVFCYAFAVARRMQDRIKEMTTGTEEKAVVVSVEVSFVDTAPVKGNGFEVGDVQYQRSYRDIPLALETSMTDYEEVLRLLSTWSRIPFKVTFQSDFWSQPTIPAIIRYMINHQELLGQQLSPRYCTLALRAACPVLGCAISEKHGRFNVYSTTAQDASITFHCPLHGPHTCCVSKPADMVRLEANAPTRNLIRSMSHLLDTGNHHIRVTGADYAGMYQEVFLYRPLAAWSAVTGLATGRTPHILYAPLITDWSGAKLSKSLYVREHGYRAMEMLGTDGLCSFAQLKKRFGDDGSKGLRRMWEEVDGWVLDPRKLFRTYSVEYLQRVVLEGRNWES